MIHFTRFLCRKVRFLYHVDPPAADAVKSAIKIH